jgi:hypothetical protein
MAVRPLRDGRYAVETEGGTYVVDLEAHTCTCPDHQLRGARCKHRRRVALEVTERLVPPPGQRTAVCAVCGGRTFVPTAFEGPALCARHDHRPGTLVRDRETGDRLIVVAAAGERADQVETEEGRLVADYPTNADYGPHEPVFHAVYLDSLRGDGDGHSDVKRYAFPASRLQPIDALDAADESDTGPAPTDGTASPTTA